jgi:hypothetical protein
VCVDIKSKDRSDMGRVHLKTRLFSLAAAHVSIKSRICMGQRSESRGSGL